MIYIALYLAAIVAANLAVATYGPSAAPYAAFAFIGLDLTARDRLHEAWHGRGLWYKMAALIAAGSILSYALNAGAGQIALASFIAFMLANVADTLIYSALHSARPAIRVNVSNIGSALVDSLAFPTLAFGVFLPWLILIQFALKVAGGLVWYLVLMHRRASDK